MLKRLLSRLYNRTLRTRDIAGLGYINEYVMSLNLNRRKVEAFIHSVIYFRWPLCLPQLGTCSTRRALEHSQFARHGMGIFPWTSLCRASRDKNLPGLLPPSLVPRPHPLSRVGSGDETISLLTIAHGFEGHAYKFPFDITVRRGKAWDRGY